jgi:hypothetical protein
LCTILSQKKYTLSHFLVISINKERCALVKYPNCAFPLIDTNRINCRNLHFVLPYLEMVHAKSVIKNGQTKRNGDIHEEIKFDNAVCHMVLHGRGRKDRADEGRQAGEEIV